MRLLEGLFHPICHVGAGREQVVGVSLTQLCVLSAQ